MNKKFSQTFRKIIFWFAVSIAFLLLLSNLAAFLDSDSWWLISLVTLVFPVLFCVTAFFLFAWLFVKPLQAILFAIPLVLSTSSLFKSFAINNTPPFSNIKKNGSLRIVTWNVGLLNLMATDATIAQTNNAAIFNELKTLNADVICLQEFFTAVVPGTAYDFIDSISKTMGYPYYYFSKDIPYFSDEYFSGNIIFSRHQIIDSSRSVYSDPHSGALLRTTITTGGDTIDIFTSRLRSVNFEYGEYETIANLKKIADPRLSGTRSMIKKLRLGFKERSGQLKLITAELNKSKRPLILTADLNDVPTGYAYATLKQNKNDVWLNKGNGLGRTFKYISPTLRIDCIFVSKDFEVIQTKRIFSIGSDHFGVVADIDIKKMLND